jgi:hypothetical protein
VPSDLSDSSVSKNVQVAPTEQASIDPIDSEPELKSDSESELSSVPSDLSDRSVPEDMQTAFVIQTAIVHSESEIKPIQLPVPTSKPVLMPEPESPKTAPIVEQAEDDIQQPVEIIQELDTKQAVADIVAAAVIAPLQSDAILIVIAALHKDMTSNTAGVKTEVIDLNDECNTLQTIVEELKAKQYEDQLARVESDISSIKEQITRNEEQNTKRHEESTAIQMATTNTVNQIFAFLKANETERKTTGFQPTLVPEVVLTPQAPIKKLAFSSVTTVYAAEPSDSVSNDTPAPGESTTIKDSDTPLKQFAESVVTEQIPSENGPVEKIGKAPQTLLVKSPEQSAVMGSAAESATGFSDSKPPARVRFEATEVALGLSKSAGAYDMSSDTSNSSQKAEEVKITGIVLFNSDGSLNEAIAHDKLLLALSRHEYDLSPDERRIVVECARSCLSLKEFWACVEDEVYGDLHEIGYDTWRQ